MQLLQQRARLITSYESHYTNGITSPFTVVCSVTWLKNDSAATAATLYWYRPHCFCNVKTVVFMLTVGCIYRRIAKRFVSKLPFVRQVAQLVAQHGKQRTKKSTRKKARAFLVFFRAAHQVTEHLEESSLATPVKIVYCQTTFKSVSKVFHWNTQT